MAGKLLVFSPTSVKLNGATSRMVYWEWLHPLFWYDEVQVYHMLAMGIIPSTQFTPCGLGFCGKAAKTQTTLQRSM